MTGIPMLCGPEMPRTETMAYRDDVAFGAPRAQPVTRVQYHVDWTDEQVLDAAQDGAAEAGALDHVEVATVCQAYVELVQQVADLRAQVDASGRLVAHALQLRDSADAERMRLAGLHARVSVENVHLRHQIAGTTPASIDVALDRASRVPEANSDFGDDTVIVDLPIGAGA